MNSINKIDTTRMTNAGHIGFMEQTIKRAKENEKVSTEAAAQVSVMEKKYATEDKYYVLSQKNDKTEQISEADTLRDTCFLSFKQTVKGFMAMPDEELAAAAAKVWQDIKEHKIDVRQNLSEENAKVTDLVQNLEDTLSADVAVLGLTRIVAKLKEANEQVKQLMYERNAEEATKIAGALRAARLEMDEAYQNFVVRVNALWVVQYDDAYDTFINEQNEQIDYYKQNVLKKRKSAKKTDTETGNTTEAETAKE